MQNERGSHENPQSFMEQLSDGLLSIYAEIDQVGFFSKDTLNHQRVDAIVAKLEALESQAKQMNEHGKAEILGRLDSSFMCYIQ